MRIKGRPIAIDQRGPEFRLRQTAIICAIVSPNPTLHIQYILSLSTATNNLHSASRSFASLGGAGVGGGLLCCAIGGRP